MVTQLKTATKPIPYVREFPIIGSIPQFMGDRLDFSLRLVQELGDVHGFHLGPVPVIVFNQPEYVHTILVEHASDFDKGRVMHKAFTGKGLFISEGEFHRKQRKLMAPSFQPRLIASYADTMVSYGEQLQQTWSDGEVIDLNQTMISVTMSIIGKVLFDANVFTETDELGRAMATIFENVTHKLTSLFVPPLSWPTPRNRRTQKAVQLLNERIQQMIDERRHTDARDLAPTRAPHVHPAAPCHYILGDHPTPDARWADAWGGGARRHVVARGGGVEWMGPCGCQARDHPETVGREVWGTGILRVMISCPFCCGRRTRMAVG